MATANVSVPDCKLVEESEERKYDCPVCLQILRDPCISQCCQNNFCHVCVKKLKKASNPCPLCRKSKFRTQRNRDLSPEVYHLQVYCPNKSKGCDWVGDLGEIDVHLNQSPVLRYQTNGCHFIYIQCCYCSKKIQRNQICDHFSVCPKRPYKCEYCQGYDSFFEDVSCNHWPICDFYPIICPNDCSECIPRHSVHVHVVKYCSMTVIECEFKQFGCTAKFTRRDMSSHMKNSVAAHESLVMMTKLFSQLKKNNREIRELETKLHEKQKNFIREQKDLFEKRMSSATNQVIDAGRQQLQSVTESLQKRNDQLIKDQRKAINKQVHEASDNTDKAVRKTLNKQICEVSDNIEKAVRSQVKGQLDSKYADHIRELRAENTRITKDHNELKMIFVLLTCGLLTYCVGWKEMIACYLFFHACVYILACIISFR